MTPTTDLESHFPFTKLPPELRDAVYCQADQDTMKSLSETCYWFDKETEPFRYSNRVYFFDWREHYTDPYQHKQLIFAPKSNDRQLNEPRHEDLTEWYPMDIPAASKIQYLWVNGRHVELCECLEYCPHAPSFAFVSLPILKRLFSSLRGFWYRGKVHSISLKCNPNVFGDISSSIQQNMGLKPDEEVPINTLPLQYAPTMWHVPTLSGGVLLVYKYFRSFNQYKYHMFQALRRETPLDLRSREKALENAQKELKTSIQAQQQIYEMAKRPNVREILWDDLAALVGQMLTELDVCSSFRKHKKPLVWFPSPTAILDMVIDSEDGIKDPIKTYYAKIEGCWKIYDLTGRSEEVGMDQIMNENRMRQLQQSGWADRDGATLV
jgi:hypothetical protein